MKRKREIELYGLDKLVGVDNKIVEKTFLAEINNYFLNFWRLIR